MAQAARGAIRGLTVAVHGLSLGVLLPVEALLGLRLSACVSSRSLTPGILDGLVSGPMLPSLGLLVPLIWIVADLGTGYGPGVNSIRARNRHLGRFMADLALIVGLLGGTTLLVCALSWTGLFGDAPIPAGRAVGWSLQVGLFVLLLCGIPELVGHMWSGASTEDQELTPLPGGRWWPWIRPWHLIVLVLPLELVFRGHALAWALWAVAFRLAVLRMDLLRHAARRTSVSRWVDVPRRPAPR